MKKAVVVYRPLGPTGYGDSPYQSFSSFAGNPLLISFDTLLAEADYLLMGCWTSGMFVILQHPDEPWMAFVRDMPETKRPRVGLFTTYKLATGSQFPKMRAALAGKTNDPLFELKSRNGHLSAADEKTLEAFLANG